MKCKSWYSKTRNSVTDCLKKNVIVAWQTRDWLIVILHIGRLCLWRCNRVCPHIFLQKFIFWVTLISRFWVPRFTFHWQYLIGSLSKDVLSDHVNRKWSFWTLRPFSEQILWQIVSIRVKTVSKTNLVASRHKKGEKRISHQDLMIINAFRK